MNLKPSLIGKFIFITICLMLLPACAAIDQTTDPVTTDTSYDGRWIIDIGKFNKEQLAPARPPYGRTRWTCGDGKPFQLALNVKNGLVHILNGKPVKVGKLTKRGKFKSVISRSEESIDIYTGNFNTQEGKIQNRTRGLNGCQFKFKLVKGRDRFELKPR
ncbi:MAG: hypothetical protein AB8B79_20070 [Granulosicoccus sp.]